MKLNSKTNNLILKEKIKTKTPIKKIRLSCWRVKLKKKYSIKKTPKNK
jgi:hypothetical protein